MNLPRYRFYIKISAIESEEPFSGVTLYSPIKKDPKRIEKLTEASRKNYASKYVPRVEPEETKEESKPKRTQDSTAKTSKSKSKDFLPEFA